MGHVNKACLKPKDCGYSAELWYPVSFIHYIRSVAEKEGHERMADVAETTLRKIFASAKPMAKSLVYGVQAIVTIAQDSLSVLGGGDKN